MDDMPLGHPSDAELLAYLDGESGLFDRLRVRRHAGRCRFCRGRMAEIQAAVALVGAALTADSGQASAAAAARARWKFRESISSQMRPPRRAGRRGLRVALAVATAAAAAVLGIVVSPHRRSEPVIPPASTSAALSLLAEVERLAAAEAVTRSAVTETAFRIEFESQPGFSRELRFVHAPNSGLHSARLLAPGGQLRLAVFAEKNGPDAIYSPSGWSDAQLNPGAAPEPLYEALSKPGDPDVQIFAWLKKQVWTPFSLAHEVALFCSQTGAELKVIRQPGATLWLAAQESSGSRIELTLWSGEDSRPELLRIAWLSPAHRSVCEVKRLVAREYASVAEAPHWIRAASVRPKPAAPSMPAHAIPLESPPPPSPAQLAAAELAVHAALHRAGLCRSDNLSIAATRGLVRVSGAFYDAGRLELVRSVLEQAGAGRFLTLDLQLVSPSGSAETKAGEPAAAPQGTNRALAEEWLRARTPGGSGLSPRELFARLDRIVTAADKILVSAWALEDLASRFPPWREALLNPEDAATLQTMVEDHRRDLAGNLAQLSRELDFSPAPPGMAFAGRWQEQAPAVRAGAQRLSELVVRYFTGSTLPTAGMDPNPERSDLPHLLAHLSRLSVAGLAQ